LTVGLSKGIQFGSKVLKFIFAKLGIDLEKFHTMFIVVIVGYFAQRMQSLVPARQRSNDILKSVSLSYLNSMPKGQLLHILRKLLPFKGVLAADLGFDSHFTAKLLALPNISAITFLCIYP
jgi:hypothetical protein